MSDSADLDRIAQEMTSSLEARIGDLLGHVRASREVTREIVEIDRELGRLHGLRDRLGGATDAEQRKRLAALDAKTDELASRRHMLVDTLRSLQGALDAR